MGVEKKDGYDSCMVQGERIATVNAPCDAAVIQKFQGFETLGRYTPVTRDRRDTPIDKK